MVGQTTRVGEIDFGGGRWSQVVFADTGTAAREILERLALVPRPRAAVSISGGAGQFPPRLAEPVRALLRCIALSLIERYDALLIDGGTEAGVMRILGEAVRRAPADTAPREAGEWGASSTGPAGRSYPFLVGFAPEPLVAYPGAAGEPAGRVGLDPNHPYFVLIRDARQWGDEVEAMFALVEHLHDALELPILSLVVNGGRITLKEAYYATRRRRPLIVLEGMARASELILAARDGEPPGRLRSLMEDRRIAVRPDEQEETLAWLAAIAGHPGLIRFDAVARPPEELRDLIDDLLRPGPVPHSTPGDPTTGTGGERP